MTALNVEPGFTPAEELRRAESHPTFPTELTPAWRGIFRESAVDGLMVALSQDKLMIFDPVQSTWITGPTAPRAIGLLSTPGALYATTADGSIMRLRY